MKQSKQLIGACTLAVILVIVVFFGAHLRSNISGGQPVSSIVQPSVSTDKCNNWQRVSIAGKQGAEGALNSIIAISPNNLWAVGDGSLIEHGDGVTWKTVKVPAKANTLQAIAAVSANDIWAVGVQESTVITLHWNGTLWAVVSTPTLSSKSSVLTSVVAIAHNNVWAVGSTDVNDEQHALILHWNGSGWKEVSGANTASSSSLSGITAVSANDIWAVGSLSTKASFTKHELIEHWDGLAWKSIAAPEQKSSAYRIESASLHSVAASSATDVWAVGEWILDGEELGSVLHWNGHVWSRVQVVTPESRGNWLNAITSVASDDIWTVGEWKNPNTRLIESYAEHWDGKSWNFYQWPNSYGQAPSNASFKLYNIVGIQHGSVWAVGSGTNVTQNPPIGDSMTHDKTQPFVFSLCH